MLVSMKDYQCYKFMRLVFLPVHLRFVSWWKLITALSHAQASETNIYRSRFRQISQFIWMWNGTFYVSLVKVQGWCGKLLVSCDPQGNHNLKDQPSVWRILPVNVTGVWRSHCVARAETQRSCRRGGASWRARPPMARTGLTSDDLYCRPPEYWPSSASLQFGIFDRFAGLLFVQWRLVEQFRALCSIVYDRHFGVNNSLHLLFFNCGLYQWKWSENPVVTQDTDAFGRPTNNKQA